MKKNPKPAPPCTCGHPRDGHVTLSGRGAHCKWWSGGHSKIRCRRCGRYTPIDGVTMHQRNTPNGGRFRVNCDHCEWTTGEHPAPETAARLGREHISDTHKETR